MSKRKDREYDYYHILNNEGGQRPFVVKGYDTWPSGVLEGQVRITFLASFNTLEEAEKAYPQASMSHELMEPQNSFNHLSDGPDDYDDEVKDYKAKIDSLVAKIDSLVDGLVKKVDINPRRM